MQKIWECNRNAFVYCLYSLPMDGFKHPLNVFSCNFSQSFVVFMVNTIIHLHQYVSSVAPTFGVRCYMTYQLLLPNWGSDHVTFCQTDGNCIFVPVYLSFCPVLWSDCFVGLAPKTGNESFTMIYWVYLHNRWEIVWLLFCTFWVGFLAY